MCDVRGGGRNSRRPKRRLAGVIGKIVRIFAPTKTPSSVSIYICAPSARRHGEGRTRRRVAGRGPCVKAARQRPRGDAAASAEGRQADAPAERGQADAPAETPQARPTPPRRRRRPTPPQRRRSPRVRSKLSSRIPVSVLVRGCVLEASGACISTPMPLRSPLDDTRLHAAPLPCDRLHFHGLLDEQGLAAKMPRA